MTPSINSASHFPNPQGLNPSNTTWTAPDLSGSHTLDDIFEHHALKSNSHPWAVWSDADPTVIGSNKLVHISYGEWFKALRRVARILQHQLLDVPTDAPSVEVEDRPLTIAILATGALDSLSYAVLVQAIIYLGHTAFPISHWNSAAAIVHLLKATQCTHLIVSGGEPIRDVVKAVRPEFEERGDVKVVEAPTFLDLFAKYGSGGNEEGDDQVILAPRRQPGMKDTALIIHSSGPILTCTLSPRP